jgi:spore coat protein H
MQQQRGLVRVRSGGARLRTAVALASAWVCACAPVANRPDRQDELYDPDVVQDISLTIAQADLDAMEAALPAEEIYVPATLVWNDVTLDDVGVKFKGNSSRGQLKRGYLIKMHEYVDQRFLGLRRVALDNGIQFGSLFSERILDEVLRAEGVVASRANYARLTINGTFQGVFVNVERIDKPFLKTNFDGEDEGNLYKCDLGGSGARLDVVDAAAYGTTFEAQTNEDTADGSDLLALATTLRDGTLDEVKAAVDVDAFVRLMPVMMLGGAFDQYTGFNAHNYYLYRDPASERWTYIAHDLDVGFADNAFGMVAVIDGWNAATPRPVSPLPLVDRVLGDPDLLSRYRELARADLTAYFTPALLGARLDALYAQIADDLARDPNPAVRVTNPDIVGYPAILDDMKAFVQRRFDTATSELAGAP